MIQAVFCDFYGTLVHEDGKVINTICQEIIGTGRAENTQQIASYWWNIFQETCHQSYGNTFQTQRNLEHFSLEQTIHYFHSSANCENLSQLLFSHWQSPPAFDDASEFLNKCPVPVYIVSNIDREDILSAIQYHEFSVAGVFTSEDARSYKPRPELFQLALAETGLVPHDVVHLGDSLSSDVNGASSPGISTLWLNRNNKPVPAGVCSVSTLLEVPDMLRFL